MTPYETLLVDALDQMRPTSVQHMLADGEEMFARVPVAIEDEEPRTTKEAAVARLREFNKCHEPAGTPEGGQFCSTDGNAAWPTDSKGRLIAYHGTWEEFASFDDEKIGSRTDSGFFGRGIYFTRDREAASKGKWTYQGAPMVVLEARVTVERPYYATMQDMIANNPWRAAERTAELQAQGYDGIITENGWLVAFKASQVTVKKVQRVVKERRVREFNPCHEPAGSETGGQFTFKGTGNCTGEGRLRYATPSPGKRTVSLKGRGFPATGPQMTKDVPFDRVLATEVLGNLDPEAAGKQMVKYMPGDWTVIMTSVAPAMGRTDPTVAIVAQAPDSSYLKRDLTRVRGKLVAQHQHFENNGADEMGKALMLGQMELYERIGVEEIYTTANISTGAYAWARYGFTAAGNPKHFADLLTLRLDGASMGATAYTSEHLNALAPYRPLIDRILATPDAYTPWKIADLRITGTPDELAPLVKAFDVRGNKTFKLSVRHGTAWNKAMRADQAKGVFNLGKVLLTGMVWDAKLDMQDQKALRRLRSYLRGEAPTKESAVTAFLRQRGILE